MDRDTLFGMTIGRELSFSTTETQGLDMVAENQLCRCHCHTSHNVMHLVACCVTCSMCGNHILHSAWEEHKRECHKLKSDDTIVPTWLLDKTYQIRHNPNCVKKFEVRLVGQGLIDGKPAHESNDRIGYGDSVEEAANQALQKVSSSADKND